MNVLATFSEFQGQGLGTKLLEVAETRARAAGARATSIIVGSWNESAARLYEREGFKAIATEPATPPPEFPLKGDWTLMLRPVDQ